jgi:tartrate-resistant acid phosphatase type 5
MRLPALVVAVSLLLGCHANPVPADAGTPVRTAVTSPERPGADAVTRFVALGDTGKGNAAQFAVAAAMKTVCDARGGCGFGLLLGDNVYPSGTEGEDDAQFRSKFEEPYADLPFPFHPVLGNHDYGGNGSGVEFWKGQSEIAYSKHSAKWRFPAAYYRFHEGLLDFFALDTNSLFFGAGTAEDQEREVPPWIAAAAGPWKIAFGHHPYVSNGPHGNAGAYDGLPLGMLPASGLGVKAFVEQHLCGKVDAYLCGHDHSLQDLGAVCGTQFLVSGGGASATPLVGTDPAAFQASIPGFLLVEATAHRLAFSFFDGEARLLHTREIRK